MSSDLHPHSEEHSPSADTTRVIGNVMIPFLIIVLTITLGGGGIALLVAAANARAVAHGKAKNPNDSSTAEAGAATPGALSPAATPAAGTSSAAPTTEPAVAVKYDGPALEIEVLPDPVNLLFKTTEFKAKAGQPVKVKFRNASLMMHNFVLIKPGSFDAMVAEADKIMTDPKGMEKGYIPQSPLVIAHTKLVQPNQEDSVEFTLPSKGEYPYVCTFPGHVRIMKGRVLVE